MGACASFPKGMNEEARAAPPPEEPKEEMEPATAEGEKEIKEDDKTLGTFLKEEKMEETKTTVIEEEKTSKTEEPVKDSPAVIEAISESPLPVSDGKVEITEIKEDKK